MSALLDPRLAARRRQVQEGWARRRLRWIVGLVAVVLVGGVGIAVLESPWLAVREVRVFGAENAPVASVLDDQELAAGVPTISVRAGAVEAALLSDPWVARAEVRVTWPGSVEITVLERTPAAWIEGSSGWVLVAVDGTVLEAREPGADAPVVVAAVSALGPGDRIDDVDIVGAIEFLGLLPQRFSRGAAAHVTASGIEAEVNGHVVLLGNHKDMPAKIATLAAILEGGVEPGTTLNVISPVRPGIANPRPLVEDTREEVSSSDVSG